MYKALNPIYYINIPIQLSSSPPVDGNILNTRIQSLINCPGLVISSIGGSGNCCLTGTTLVQHPMSDEHINNSIIVCLIILYHPIIVSV